MALLFCGTMLCLVLQQITDFCVREGSPEELVFGLRAEFVDTQLEHFKAFSSLWLCLQKQVKINSSTNTPVNPFSQMTSTKRNSLTKV